MQFHPTCLYNLEVKNFLITEAVRGEGGQLKHPDDRPPLHARFRRARRARAARRRRARDRPRDQAATASITSISTSATSRRSSCSEHFPNIYEKLLGLGIDMTKEPIPVVPGAALYLRRRGDRSRRAHRSARPLCGGRSAPRSGLHGANRLASNSLLECFVFGEAAAKHIAAHWDDLPAAAADPRLGRKPRHRFRRGGGDQAELDRDPPLHVELCRHRPHHQAARARRSTASSC